MFSSATGKATGLAATSAASANVPINLIVVGGFQLNMRHCSGINTPLGDSVNGWLGKPMDRVFFHGPWQSPYGWTSFLAQLMWWYPGWFNGSFCLSICADNACIRPVPRWQLCVPLSCCPFWSTQDIRTIQYSTQAKKWCLHFWIWSVSFNTTYIQHFWSSLASF
jgi:hypothetical protein